VIKEQILRINPGAEVITVTEKVSLEPLGEHLDTCDVFFAQSEDLALSVHALKLCQQKKKLAITVMPSGLTAYVEVFPPGLKKVVDPAAMFGSPANLSTASFRPSSEALSTAAAGAGTLPKEVEYRLVQTLAGRKRNGSPAVSKFMAGGVAGGYRSGKVHHRQMAENERSRDVALAYRG